MNGAADDDFEARRGGGFGVGDGGEREINRRGSGPVRRWRRLNSSHRNKERQKQGRHYPYLGKGCSKTAHLGKADCFCAGVKVIFRIQITELRAERQGFSCCVSIEPDELVPKDVVGRIAEVAPENLRKIIHSG